MFQDFHLVDLEDLINSQTFLLKSFSLGWSEVSGLDRPKLQNWFLFLFENLRNFC